MLKDQCPKNKREWSKWLKEHGIMHWNKDWLEYLPGGRRLTDCIPLIEISTTPEEKFRVTELLTGIGRALQSPTIALIEGYHYDWGNYVYAVGFPRCGYSNKEHN